MAILLILLMSYPALRNFGYTLDYRLDVENYKALCENLDQPSMHCDGRCVLAKKIEQTKADQNPEVPQMIDDYNEFVLTSNQCTIEVEVERAILIGYRQADGSEWLQDIEHPPKARC